MILEERHLLLFFEYPLYGKEYMFTESSFHNTHTGIDILSLYISKLPSNTRLSLKVKGISTLPTHGVMADMRSYLSCSAAIPLHLFLRPLSVSFLSFSSSFFWFVHVDKLLYFDDLWWEKIFVIVVFLFVLIVNS